jgi:hypothetical protein
MHPDFSYYLARARIADLLRPAQPGLRHAGHLRQFHRDRRPLHHAAGTPVDRRPWRSASATAARPSAPASWAAVGSAMTQDSARTRGDGFPAADAPHNRGTTPLPSSNF